MTKFKKLLSFLLAVLMLACILPFSVLAEGDASEFSLSVNPYGNAEDSIDTITWYETAGLYFLFLPADCDMSALTVYFNSDSTVTANGRKLVSGEPTDVFSTCDKFIIQCGMNTYILNVMKSAKIPAMYIETDKPLDYINADKNNKSSGVIRTYEGGEMSLDSELKQIKGRGNSTWDYDKKPYNIKFDDKTSLLGMPKAKKWSMLASYIDPAIIKNPIGWELSNQIGLSFASEYRFVDLYINGEYMGNYIVCESVEVGDNRVNITDLTKATEKANDGADLESFPIGGSGPDGLPEAADVYPRAKWVNIPNNPADITGGYLLECDYPSRADREVSEFVTSRGQAVVLKEPEYASEAQVKYIGSYWQEAEDAICSPDGYNSLGKHYSEYFDVASLVDMYILLEFSGNADAGVSSTYFHKDKGGKLVAGPIWDNDTAFGNISLRGSVIVNDPSLWITNRMNYSCSTSMPTEDEYPTIYNLLYRHQEFRDMVSTRWAELSGVFNCKNINSLINTLADTVEASALMNGVRWYTVFPKDVFVAAVDMSTTYLEQRIKWLSKGFGKNAANLYYDPNGGTGWSIENKILQKGEYAIVNGPYNSDLSDILDISSISDIPDALATKISPPAEGLEFAGWNTKPDGSGTTYQPGSLIRMNGTVTLYAQWKTVQPARSLGYSYAMLIDNPLYDLGMSAANVIGSYWTRLSQRYSW